MAGSEVDEHGLTVTLVGCGLWGRLILRDLVALGVRVDLVEPHAAARAEALNLGAATARAELADALLDRTDGVVVATPASTHAAVIADVLDRTGVPVLTEKPFTTDAASAARLAARAPDRLFVGHVWRYHRGVEALAAIARSGELGPVELLRSTRTNWTSPRNDVDPVWTLAPHDLSIALEILGSLPDPRHATAEWLDDRPCGLLGVLGERPSVIIEISTRHADKRRVVRLHARDGVAVLDASPGSDAEVITLTRDAGGTLIVERRLLSAGDPPLRRELAAFCAHLRGGPPPRSAADDGVRVVESLCALRRLAGIDP